MCCLPRPLIDLQAIPTPSNYEQFYLWTTAGREATHLVDTAGLGFPSALRLVEQYCQTGVPNAATESCRPSLQVS